MNERNVATIAGLLAEYRAQHTAADGPGGPSASEGEWTDGLDVFLAAQGVLVPSALSPEQMAVVGEVVEREMAGSGANDPEAFEVCVRLLERLAKGMI